MLKNYQIGEQKLIKETKSVHWQPDIQLHKLLLFIFTAIGIYLCYAMALPFLPALVWATTFAVLFSPFQTWLELKVKNQNLATLVAVFAISLMAIAPAILVGQQLAVQAINGALLIEAKVNDGLWQRIIDDQPRLAPLVKELEAQINLPETIKNFSLWVTNSAGAFIKGSLYQLVGFILTIYMLFFFLRDRHAIKQGLSKLLPLSDREAVDLFTHIDDTIHATVYGTLGISLAQGFLGGLMFWWLGLPAPLLWGLVMALLAFIPMLGAFIIWGPAALFLLVEGNWQQAIILMLWGVLVVGTVDNLLRPMLMANRLKLHTLLMFVSLVGGLLAFGSSGIILGPVVLAITLFLISVWTARKEN